MITLHDAKETNFEKNGYGVLDDLVFNDGGSWEMNGEFKITFEVPALTEFTKYVEARNIVKVPVPFMDRQLFRIYRTEKTLSSIYVEARHIFYDLLDNWIEDTNIVGQMGNSAIQQLLSRTQYPHRFTATSDITATGSARIVRMNPVEALLDDQKENSFVNRWGGELVRNNFQLELLKRMGADRGVKIEHRKDLLGYEATIDISTIVTRLHPVGFDGLELPEKYVDSPLMDSDHPIIAEVKYENIKAAIGEYSDDEEAVPLEQAYDLLRQAAINEFTVNHVDEPETVVNVDFVALHNTEQYEDFADLQEVRAGDTVKVSAYDHGFEITSRLVGFEFSLLKKDHYTSTTLGNHVLEYTSSETDVNDLRERVEEAERTAVTATLAANGRNRNFFGAEDPNTLELDARLGDNYFLENGESFIIYLYVEVNGEKYWKRASLDEVAFKNEMKENTRIVNEATETAGQALTAGNQAKELANQAKIAAENASEVGGQALTAGQQAQELANEAKADSSSALLKANEAISSTNTLTTRVDTLNSEYDGLQTIVQGKASQTEVTQLSTQIDLRVEKDKIVNQINVSTEGILIAGSKTHITGQTTIDTGVIETAHIENAAINNAKIADLAVNEAKIASLAVTTSKIGTAAISEAKIADLAVTTAKIANAAISSAKIGEAAIKTAHIGDAQITTAKISSLSASKITTGTLNASDVNIININASRITTGIIGGSAGNSWNMTTGLLQTVMEGTNTRAELNGGVIRSYSDRYGMAEINGGRIDFDDGTYRVGVNPLNLYFAKGNNIRNLYWNSEGLEIQPGPFNTGTDLNNSIYLKGITNAAHNYIQFEDPQYNHRIRQISSNFYIEHDNSGELRITNRSRDTNSGIVFAYVYATRHDTDQTIQLIQNRLQTPRDGTRDILLSPNGQGKVRVANTDLVYYPIRASAFEQASSRKLKTKIKDYTGKALDIINSLSIVEYEYIKNVEEGVEDRQLGLIAEDSPSVSSSDCESINTYRLMSYHTKSIQELSKQRDRDLTTINGELNVANSKIEHIDNYLKNRVETRLERDEKKIKILEEKIRLMEESA